MNTKREQQKIRTKKQEKVKAKKRQQELQNKKRQQNLQNKKVQQEIQNEEQQKLDAENLQQELQNKLNEIREFADDGNYIFRGENKIHDKISSILRRHFQTIRGRAVLQQSNITLDLSFIEKPLESQLEKQYGKNVPKLDFDAIEKSLKENVLNQLAQHSDDSLLVEEIQSDLILQEVKEYVDFKNEIDILVELQHYGGSTNLIDFSHDLAVALFFACNGEPEKPGRLILLNKKAKGIVSPPKNQNNRIIFQKSVFVRRDDGCIDEREEEVEKIIIPQNLKKPLLTYVQNYFKIKTETVYGDLMGYIKNQERHDEAYKEFFSGTIYGDNNRFEKAIDCYTNAIKIKPNFGTAYNNRGSAKAKKKLPDLKGSLDDYTKAIELNPNNAGAYSNRSATYNNRGREGDYDLAIADCNKAIEINRNEAEAYCNRGIAKRILQKKGAKEDLETALRLAKQQENKPLAAFVQKEINKLSPTQMNNPPTATPPNQN